MNILLKLGSFDLAGNKDGLSCYFDSYRRFDMLVLEFYNNAILPIQISRCHGVNFLKVCGSTLFNIGFPDDATFDVHLRGSLNCIDVHIVILYGEHEEYVDIDVFGDMNVCGKIRSFAEISSFAKKHGVVLPVGCSGCVSQYAGTFGCEFQIRDNYYLFTFPNGFKFPVFKIEFGVKVVEAEICFHHPMRCMCIKVKKMTPDLVVFRFIVIAGDMISCCDDIEYGRVLVKYGGHAMKTANLTKMLVMNQ